MLEGLGGLLIMIVLHSGFCWGTVLFLGFMWVLGFGVSVGFEFWDERFYLGMLGGDLMSLGLIFLSVWVILMMFLVSFSGFEMGWLGGLFLMLTLVLVGVFLSLDFMMFYLMFEFVLVPTLVLILGWGYQPERLSAGVYLLFYTVLCSIPFLLVLLLVGGVDGSVGVFLFERVCGGYYNILVGLMAMMIFMVSVPMYGLHFWLPKAHVEAPVFGSMILAGVLLSLGGYGLMSYLIYEWGIVCSVSSFFVVLSLMGGIILSLVCLRQVDLKALIAYSSVVHMGLVVAGVFSGYGVGWVGSYIMMVGHGLCSSGLFYFSGVNYSRLGSRSVVLSRGLMGGFPSGALIWFLLVAANMSFPPSLNFVGEVMLMGSVLGLSSMLIFFLLGVSFFTGAYCLFLYSWVQHGVSSVVLKGGENVLMSEGLVVFLHWVPLNCLILSADLFMLF